MEQKTLPSWIAVDWGTSNLRVWAMDDNANILATQSSPLGMNAIAGDEKLSFEGVLIDLIDGWLPADVPDGQAIPVVICGMAGAKQGWLEAPYCEVPTAPADLAMVQFDGLLNEAVPAHFGVHSARPVSARRC